MAKTVYGPDEASQRLFTHIGSGAGAGLLFGREKWGLNNEEIALSDAIVTLPVEPAFASLNIAQAVLVLAYEWRRTANADQPLPFETPEAEPATKDELLGFFVQLEEALDRSGFFKTKTSAPLWLPICAPCCRAVSSPPRKYRPCAASSPRSIAGTNAPEPTGMKKGDN